MGLEGYREEVSVLNLRGKFEVRNADVPWRCLWLGEVFLTSWCKSVLNLLVQECINLLVQECNGA